MSLILHDFMLLRGGAERLVLTLSEGLCVPLITGFDNSEGQLEGMIHPLGKSVNGKLARYLIPAHRFLKLNPGFLEQDWVIYSGVIAPMAVHQQHTGFRIHYCHSPPRFLYDLRDYYHAKLGVPGRVGLELLDRWLRPRYEEAVRKMDVVVANSENVRRRLQRYLGLDARVVYPPIDTHRFRWRGQKDFFLSLARLEDFKRVDLIVEAFRRMPHQQLVVASGGSQEPLLRRRAAGCGNITFTSWLNEKALAELVGCCRSVIYLPRDEDFGMSPVEAMAAGKPVIGVAEGGLLETVVDGETGALLSPSPTIEEISDAVERFDALTAFAMREACEERAQLFSVSVFLQRMKEIVGS